MKDREILEYVADMARQLACLCADRYPVLAASLNFAAASAEEILRGFSRRAA